MEVNNLSSWPWQTGSINGHTFLILATKEARDSILEHNLVYNHEKLKVSVTHDRDSRNPSELRISKTLVVNNLPQKEFQSTIEKIFNKDNIIGVSFRHIPKHKQDRQVRWCHIQCLNAMVYAMFIYYCLNMSCIVICRKWMNCLCLTLNVSLLTLHWNISNDYHSSSYICLAPIWTSKQSNWLSMSRTMLCRASKPLKSVALLNPTDVLISWISL